MKIRSALLADAGAIARTHVAIWRVTYRHLAPPAAMAALDEARRRTRWIETLSQPKPDQIALVAEIDGQLAGFCLAGAPIDPAFGGRGEIKYLYVDEAFHRQGIGRGLMAKAASRLVDRGYAAIALGVVVGNTPAIDFYEAMGGRAIGAYTDPGPLWRSNNIVYAWDDVAVLTR